MIKKIIFSSIIIICLLSPVSSFAMEISLPQVGGLADLGYGLSIGAEFDFNGSKYVVRDWDHMSSSERQSAVIEKAWDFMSDYCISRGLPYPTASGEPLPLDEYGFFKSVYFDSNIKKVFSNYLTAEDAGLNSDATLRMPISRQAISDWSLYREDAWKRYKDNFYFESEDISAQPNPDYIGYINIINSSTLANVVKSNNTINAHFVNNNISLCGGFSGTDSSYQDITTNESSFSRRFQCMQPITFNITTVPGGYNVTYNFDVIYGNILEGSSTYKDVGYYRNDGIVNNAIIATNWTVNTSRPFNQGFYSSLSTIFNNIKLHFKLVNIYVDDVPWAYAFEPEAPANPIIPDFPDVIDPDGDLPVDLVDLPATTDNEGTFDITSLFDALKEAIIGASDSDNTTSGTLTGEAVKDTYRDKTGELVADEALPLADIIDDSFPIQDTMNYPTIPMIDKPIHDAFSGTTILAQLIHAVDTVLPESLMVVFWGIIFVLFILGLIKVLHK